VAEVSFRSIRYTLLYPNAVHYDAPRTPHAEELMSASSDLFEASQTIALAHVLRPRISSRVRTSDGRDHNARIDAQQLHPSEQRTKLFDGFRATGIIAWM